MSFTSEIKQEIAYNELKNCCMKAELSALIQLTSSLSISNRGLQLVVRSENPTTVKRIVYLLKKTYDYKTELTVVQKTNLKKNNIYTLDILADARAILEDLGLYSTKGLLPHPSYLIVNKDCCSRAYLAGAFLAFGSCNSPSKADYHLELTANDLEHAEFCVKLIQRYNIDAKITKRRNRYIVYIKRAENIGDFLRMIGANESLMNFENSRIARDFKNSLVRLSNVDIANQVKSLNAAKEQLAAMNRLIDSKDYEKLDPKLRAVVDLRVRYPEHSLNELCEEYQSLYGDAISKSGMKHRINKIMDMAENLKDSGEC